MKAKEVKGGGIISENSGGINGGNAAC